MSATKNTLLSARLTPKQHRVHAKIAQGGSIRSYCACRNKHYMKPSKFGIDAKALNELRAAFTREYPNFDQAKWISKLRKEHEAKKEGHPKEGSKADTICKGKENRTPFV